MSVQFWIVAVMLTVLTVFLLDWMVAPTIAIAALYALPILLAALSGNRLLLAASTVVCMILTGLVIWMDLLSPVEAPFLQSLINGGLGVAVILITSSLGLVLMRQFSRLEQARDDIDKQQSLLKMAGQMAEFGGWFYDLGTGTVTWTDQVAEIHETEPGFSPQLDEAIGFYTHEYQSSVSRAIERCLEDGEPWDEEWKVVTARNRQEIWVHAIGAPVHDSSGKIVGAQGAFQNIDARKRAEESARNSRERFQQLADSLPLFVWTTTADGSMDFLNRYGLDFVGVEDLYEVEGEKWLTRLHPMDRAGTVEKWLRAIETGKPYEIEFRLRRYDGEYRWHKSSASPILDSSGRIDRWFGACIDIEEQRRLADRLVNTLESTNDIFYALDHEWRFVYVNARAEEISGKSREEMVGRVIWDLFPEVRDTEFHHNYLKAMETGQSVQFTEHYEPYDVWLDVTAYPSEDGLSVYMRDFTAQHETEAQLQQSRRLESIGQLSGGIAHDFNNLLSVIMGNVELIRELGESQPEILSLVEDVATAVERGSNLTRRLLAFSRRQLLEPQPVDVNRLIIDMDEMLRRTLGGHIEVHCHTESELGQANVDPGQLENALLNLCLNARDAMPDGGELVIKTFRFRHDRPEGNGLDDLQSGDYIGIMISDTGVGIEEDTLTRIFEPFFTTKDKHEGTGLGLAMVYGFVKQSGGHVQARSTPGQGTVIELYLPSTNAPARLRENEPDSFVGGDETVLVVEDDQMVREFAVLHLESLGYSVLQAESGGEALELLDKFRNIDLLFTDVIMPGGMSGRELADAVMEQYPEIRILFTSGYTDDIIVNDGRLKSDVKLLSKPYRRYQLAQAVRRALDC